METIGNIPRDEANPSGGKKKERRTPLKRIKKRVVGALKRVYESERAQGWSLVALTFIASGFTGGLLWYSYLQFGLYESAVRIENRPYVAISSITMDTTKIGEHLQIMVTTQNVGKTPAYRSKLSVWAQIGLPIPNDWAPGPTPLEDSASIQTEGAGLSSIASVFSTGTISAESNRALNTGRVNIIVYGAGEYSDIWGEVHHFRFCQYWEYHRKAFVGYPRFNDAD